MSYLKNYGYYRNVYGMRRDEPKREEPKKEESNMVSVFQSINGGLKLVAAEVDTLTAMDYVWDIEINTEEHPVRIFNCETGAEIEW